MSNAPPASAHREKVRRIMPLQDARPGYTTHGPTGTFRRQVPGKSNSSRLEDILAGSEKLLAEAFVAAITNGMAVMLSPTSDGGALGVHAWLARRHWKDYVTSSAELEEVLEGLRDFKPSPTAPDPLRALSGPVRRS